MKSNNTNKELFLFITTIVVIGFLSWCLLDNYSGYFEEVKSEYRDKKIIDFSKPVSESLLAEVLVENNYIENEDDALFVARSLKKRLDAGDVIADIKDLRKKNWCLTLDEIKSNTSPYFKDKLSSLQEDSAFLHSITNSGIYESSSNGKIIAKVIRKPESSNKIKELFNKLTKKDAIPCEGVAVKLCEHTYDSLTSSVIDTIVGYKLTNKDGVVEFSGLELNKSYSVLPVSSEYTYGNAKGTFGGNLGSVAKDGVLELKYPFIERPITVQMLSNSTLNKIRKEHRIIVRSPESFKKAFTGDILTVLFAWCTLFFVLSYVSTKRRIHFDKRIITCLAFLTSISMIMMYSMTDPLTDRLIGKDTVWGIEVGILIIFLIYFTNIISFYQDRSHFAFDWLSNKFSSLPKGISYVLLALILTLMLFTPFGQEVGGMKVNLNLGILFQPSEIAKYLVVIFMAAFFCVHENAIIRYSQSGNANLFWNKLRYMGAILLGLGFLILLYMFLGDMGPGLVIAISFVLLYSCVKSKIADKDLKAIDAKMLFSSDVMLLFTGVISFSLFLFIGANMNCTFIFAIVWFVVWITGGLLLKKQVYESPIILNVVITLFVFGGEFFLQLSKIPHLGALQSIGERLDSRIQMCLNTWGELGLNDLPMCAGENTQVADGIWALASGGIFGQGVGEGSPNLIPAFHTDMILSSIGENLGFVFLFLIILVMSNLLKRSLDAGYRTGNQFGLFLTMGIVIVTAVQLFIIVFGSTGIIPLTGVTVPFLSYGKVSLILNMTAFGLILSLSKQQTKVNNTKQTTQNIFTTKGYKYTISSMSLIYLIIACGICCTYLNYQLVNRDSTLIRPLFVTNSNGAPVVQYNPRISLLTELLQPGNVYDRNGILLATSNKDTLNAHNLDYDDCYIDINKIATKGKKRFYPFGNHLMFVLGDINEQILSENIGYMADARHLSYLRGYDNQLYDEQGSPVKVRLTSNKYSDSPFLPVRDYTSSDSYSLRDYSVLIPLLKEGIKHNESVEDINARVSSFWKDNNVNPKDLTLTLDAKLQHSIQTDMQSFVSKNYKTWNCLRMSAVILDANTGELLTSAVYPLPDATTIKEAPAIYSDRDKSRDWLAYTDMDLGLKFPTPPGSTAKVMSALSAIKKDGKEAVQQKYYIHPLERIEVFKNGGGEPSGYKVPMEDAIVISSNCYFINLVNKLNTYKELSDLYKTVGIQCNFVGEDGKFTPVLPYSLQYSIDDKTNKKWNALFDLQAANALAKFEKYDEIRNNSQLKNANQRYRKMNDNEWALAWGQGIITATPLTMARVVSLVSNNGSMPTTKFVISEDKDSSKLGITADTPQFINYFENHNTSAISDLASFMVGQANKYDIGKPYANKIGGKTGTPERRFNKNTKLNDGWYICFVRDCAVNGQKHDLAIAVRMERLYRGQSGNAMSLVRDVVLPQLAKHNYIQYK